MEILAFRFEILLRRSESPVPRRDNAFLPANALSRGGTVLFCLEMVCPVTGRCFFF